MAVKQWQWIVAWGVLGLAAWTPAVPTHAQPPGSPEARPPLTWEALDQRLDAEEADGFSGVILMVRDGKIVTERAFGMANREKKIPNTLETVFAIGSTPIDFTKAGILLLVEQGKLQLEDPITKFFPDVPADKQSITVEHLMHARSGLRDFHDLPSDQDPDHAWIDREEAVRRILAQELLFEPGKGRQHSHSAWGLLAAILEVVGGEPYQEFTRKHLFEPAGMLDTGFFGEPVSEDRLAIGQGSRVDGEINAPPYWGKTSWLVMGSGGQTSTIGDMFRWITAMRSGKVLSPESAARYFSPPGSVLAGGDAYGYGIVYTEGPGSFMIAMTNNDGPDRREKNQRLANDLAALVNRGNLPKYSLGIAMEVNPEGQVTVDQVMPGSAAEKGGILRGDILLKANGKSLAGNPSSALREPLTTGALIEFELERAGEHKTIQVQPVERKP